eukprot:TRINITY_DN45814_c0_g1_i1.p1 TRINITY_DN45814_c0_g1~~TRINITY_DN45814_c0_g1_i1.p1  ORF type:complete len:680 (+),score=141.02 TRINITY_DN45814_c0_g1_i1:243-2042(+)
MVTARRMSLRFGAAAAASGTTGIASAPTTDGRGRLIVDTGLCLAGDLSTVRAVELRSAPGAPLSGLTFVLVRRNQQTRAAAGEVAFSVIASDDFYARGFELSVCGTADSGYSIAEKYWEQVDGCASHRHATFQEEERLRRRDMPAGALLRIKLKRPMTGLAGDCLGWYQSHKGTGAVERIAVSSDAATSPRTFAVTRPDLPEGIFTARLLAPDEAASEGAAVAWRLSLSPGELLQLPRSRRILGQEQIWRSSGNTGGLTTLALKRDLMSLFSQERWASTTIVEVGAGAGPTTAVLSLLFSNVIATELHCVLLRYFPPGLHNVMRLCLDSYKPYSLSMLNTENNVRAAMIDGDHDANHVFSDTFRVLHDIPCCVSVIAYHDYCDDVVYKTIQLFVNAKILRFRRPLGENPGRFRWCRDGRAEGAAFDVLRETRLHARLEELRRTFLGFGTTKELKMKLDGSTWMVHSVQKQLAYMELQLPPKVTKLSWLERAPDGIKEMDLGQVNLGYSSGAVSRRWTEWSVIGRVGVPRQSANADEANATIIFDAELTGFTLELGGELFSLYGALLGKSLIGIRNSHTYQVLIPEMNARTTESVDGTGS